MHHKANLFGQHIPFTQMVECKVNFAFAPVDGTIVKFVDMRMKDFQENEVVCLLPRAQKTSHLDHKPT